MKLLKFNTRSEFDDFVKLNSGLNDLDSALTSKNNGVYGKIALIVDTNEIYVNKQVFNIGTGGEESAIVEYALKSEVQELDETKQDIISDLSTIREGAAKGATALQEHQDISGKQDVLVSGTSIKTINGTSLLGSGNLVIEGGSGDSSGSGAYSEVSHGTSDTTFTLTPNTFHVWDEVSELTLTLGDETAGVANEFVFQFTSGSEPTALTLPDNLKWPDDDTLVIEADKMYQLSILKGAVSVLSWNNAPALIENKAVLTDAETGAVRFQYPVASEVVVTLKSDMAKTLTFNIGDQQKYVSDWPSMEPYFIVAINPESDTTYYYTY